MQTGQRVGEAQQPHRASEKEKGASGNRDDTEDVENETHPPSACWGSSASGGAALITKATEAKAARRASPRATSSTPRTPVAAATSRSEVIPPVPRSCAAIMRSAFEGPPRMRTRPTATVNRMKPAAASRKSVMAERPDKHSLFLGQIGGNWLAGIECSGRGAPRFR